MSHTERVNDEHAQDENTVDEGIRFESTLEGMQGLKTLAEEGVITAGTSSQISDGAAAVMIASAEAVKKYNLPVLKENEYTEEVAKVMASDESPDSWERQINLPVNQEIMDGLSVDDEVVITLHMTVTELRSSKLEGYQSGKSQRHHQKN